MPNKNEIVNQAYATPSVVTAANNNVIKTIVNINDYEQLQQAIIFLILFMIISHFFLAFPPFFGSATTALDLSLLSFVPVTSSKNV